MSLFDQGSRILLRALRLPPEPTPPFGAPGSVRVFRAGRNFYRLRLLVWGMTQVSTLAGLVVAIVLLQRLEQDAAAFRASAGMESPAMVEQPEAPDIFGIRLELPPEAVQFAASMPPFFFVLLTIGELLGVVGFVAQIPVTYAAVRLDFELRWYIVTDRSLRIRAGIFKLQESTMSFANIQQVVVSQGPLQRLLNIADLRVQSAGGGGGSKEDQSQRDSMHTGIFHGVDNATEIRDLILERLRRFRETGLGDPDDRHELVPAPAEPDGGGAVSAAQEVLAEVRRLRQVFEFSSSGKR